MSDLNMNPENPDATPEEQATADNTTSQQPTKVVFKIGANRIVADETTAKFSNEQARTFLKASYPEVVNATIRERIDGDTKILEVLPQPGRKG